MRAGAGKSEYVEEVVMAKPGIVVFLIGLMLAGCSREDRSPAVDGGKERIAAPSTKPQAALDALAEVNGIPVHREEFLRYAEPYPESLKASRSGLERVLQSYVDNLLLEQEAHRRGLDREAEYLAKVENYRRNLLQNTLLQREAGDQNDISEDEARAWYQAHPEQFDHPERVHLRHILVDDEKLARELKVRLARGESFEKLARQYSQDRASRSRGGDLGVFSRRQRPELAEAAFALTKPDQVAGPVKTSRGYHLIQLVRRLPASKETFEQARQSLLGRLRAARRQETKRKLLEKLRSTARLRVNQQALEALVGKGK